MISGACAPIYRWVGQPYARTAFTSVGCVGPHPRAVFCSVHLVISVGYLVFSCFHEKACGRVFVFDVFHISCLPLRIAESFPMCLLGFALVVLLFGSLFRRRFLRCFLFILPTFTFAFARCWLFIFPSWGFWGYIPPANRSIWVLMCLLFLRLFFVFWSSISFRRSIFGAFSASWWFFFFLLPYFIPFFYFFPILGGWLCGVCELFLMGRG